MNFNASRNVSAGGGLRKAKRVSDVTAMGGTSPMPGYSPGPQAYNTGPQGYNPVYPNTAQTQYQEGFQIDPSQDFIAPSPQSGNLGFMQSYPNPSMASPAQLGTMLQQPVVQDMALEYGSHLAAQGRAVVQRELDKFVPVSRLRYYFAVDTRYVMQKLLLILFPYRHKEWMVKYDQDSPVQPRYELNAPDLYIPSMGYVSYVLLAGFMLGLQHRFSPEQIGIQASSALAYIIFEILLYLVTLYVTNTTTNLRTLDLLAYSGYKYTVMIASLLAGLALGRTAYYCCLAYCSLALSCFLVKSLRVQVLSGSQAPEPPSYGPLASPYGGAGGGGQGAYGGTKRRVYFLLFVAVTQPLLSWWLTYHLVPSYQLMPAALAGALPSAAPQALR